MRLLRLLALLIIGSYALSVSAERPLVRDFVGLNGHYKFKPALYQPVCRLVRNYHNMNWDVAAPGDPITFPVCVNKVNWETVYSKWTQAGFEVNVCAMFGSFGQERKDYLSLWEGQSDWMEDYGYQMAKVLSRENLASSIEIGNEPGSEFDDALYRSLFRSMASGIRRADPNLKILTCTVQAATADKYHKQLDETFGDPDLLPLFDVISVHVYSMKKKKDQRHPWERSYPEDPDIDYLKRVDDVIRWRDRKAPGKEIWITEFGYDACSEAAMSQREGWSKKLDWSGQTELEQAQWLVRSLLCFTARGVDRAYIYFYNDEDKAGVHAASGLTRNFKPKPAYWAIQQFYELLGDYRFNRSLKEAVGELYAYEFVNDEGQLIWVLWSPTGSGRRDEVYLQQLPSSPKEVWQLSTAEASHQSVNYKTRGQGIVLEVGESPIYVKF